MEIHCSIFLSAAFNKYAPFCHAMPQIAFFQSGIFLRSLGTAGRQDVGRQDDGMNSTYIMFFILMNFKFLLLSNNNQLGYNILKISMYKYVYPFLKIMGYFLKCIIIIIITIETKYEKYIYFRRLLYSFKYVKSVTFLNPLHLNCICAVGVLYYYTYSLFTFHIEYLCSSDSFQFNINKHNVPTDVP